MSQHPVASATQKPDWATATGFVLVVIAYAALSGAWTDTSTGWYDNLDKPWFQPPGVVFGIIWPLNFLALMVVGVLVSRNNSGVARRALAVFTVSVGFALGWAYLFNQSRELVAAAVALVLAALLTWALLAVRGPRSSGLRCRTARLRRLDDAGRIVVGRPGRAELSP